MGNADVHEEARWARLHAARQRDDAHDDELDAIKQKALAARMPSPCNIRFASSLEVFLKLTLQTAV